MDLFEGEFDVEDLFMNSKNDNTDSFIIPGEKKATFEFEYEKQHCVEYDKYLVPLFSEEKDSTLIGNGVIIGQYLITAAHVVIRSSNKKDYIGGTVLDYLYYKFENRYYKLIKDKIVCGGKGFDFESEIHEDYVVFGLDKTYNSFVLSEKEIELDMELLSCPFNYKMEMLEETQNVSKVVSRFTNACEKAPVEWKNCFRVLSKHRFDHGDSGCALFQKDILYGIFLRWYRREEDERERGCEHVAIKSKYIKEKIDEYESKQNKIK